MKKELNPNWVKDAIFYQIFPERFFNGNPENDPPNTVPWESKPTRNNFFGGDLEGIIKKLDYLKELGINAIYLNPIFKANKNHKYDTIDYLDIDPHFGNINDFRKLLKEAHKLGIRIVLDGVFNHCGTGFWAFKDVSIKGINSKYYNWFILNGDQIENNPINYQTAGGCYYLPKLNLNNPETKKYIIEVVKKWTEMGIDGWRLDIPWKVPTSFWKLFRKTVKEINSNSYIVGEIWRDATPWLRNNLFDGSMNYRLRELILDFCIRDFIDAEDFNYELKYLGKIYKKNTLYMLNMLGSHDTPRILTIAKKNYKRTLLAIVFQFTFYGVPMIYYGDELGMKGGNDPDCRKAMIWNEKLWNLRFLNLYKKLIVLRKHNDCLRSGDFLPLLTFNRVYAYLRFKFEDCLITVLNSGEKQKKIKILIPKVARKYKNWKDVIGGRTFKTSKNKLIIKNIPKYHSYILEPIKF